MAANSNLTIRHIFNAPRSMVWKLWTDPEHLAQWWGPEDFTTPVYNTDVRAGGALHIDMQGPDGTIYPVSGVFREVTKPERLIFTTSPLDNAGNKTMEVLHTVTFKELGKRTELVLTAEVLTATPQATPFLDGMEAGWNQSLRKLDRELERRKKQ